MLETLYALSQLLPTITLGTHFNFQPGELGVRGVKATCVQSHGAQTEVTTLHGLQPGKSNSFTAGTSLYPRKPNTRFVQAATFEWQVTEDTAPIP